MRLEELKNMVEAIVKDNTDAAKAHFKNASSEILRGLMEKNKCDDDDKDYDKDDKDDDNDDKDDKDSKKKKPDWI